MKTRTRLASIAGFLFVLLIANSASAYYDPNVGRFISRDPIGYSDGPNEYQYAIGNPINATDPSGKFADLTFSLSASKISAKRVNEKGSGQIPILEVKNVFSGNGKDTNNPDSQHIQGHGPIPLGDYCILAGKDMKGSGSHVDHPKGDWTWYPLHDLKNPRTGEVKVKNPDTGKTVIRSGFFLHTGRESNGCVTVWSTEEKYLDKNKTQPNPKYPHSDEFDALKKFIGESKPYYDSIKCVICNGGILHVKP